MSKISDLFAKISTCGPPLSVALFTGCLTFLWFASPQQVAVAAENKASGKEKLKIIAFGDSLTAGYGLKTGNSFPVRLQAALASRHHKVAIENAGVSGDTTSGGLDRLDWAVPPDADGVILALGANDALRGINPDRTRNNLNKMLEKLKIKKIKVLLVGMEAPRNLGNVFGNKFRQLYRDLASKYGVLFYPFFLKDVALNPDLNQKDGIHPNARGVNLIVKNILPDVEKLITRIRKSR